MSEYIDSLIEDRAKEYNQGMSEGFYWASISIKEIQQLCWKAKGSDDLRLKIAAICEEFLKEAL